MFNKKVIIDSLRNLNKPSKTTNRNSFDFNEPDRTEEGFISAQEGVETPIYKAVRVGPSPIEGKGLFAEQAIKKGDVIGVSHIRQNFTKNGEEYRAPFPSTVLGYYNHSEEPNVYEVDKGDHILMVAGRDIQRGQEITSNYSKHNIEDLEVPEDFKKGGANKRPKMPKGKSPRSYSRSFEATNKLFTENPLFAKPKSRKNKIFDPRAQYYANGGLTQYKPGGDWPPLKRTAVYANPTYMNNFTGGVNNTESYFSKSPLDVYKQDPAFVVGAQIPLSKYRHPDKEMGKGWMMDTYLGMPYSQMIGENAKFLPSAGLNFDYEAKPTDNGLLSFTRPNANIGVEYSPTDGLSFSGTAGPRIPLTPYGNKRVKPGYGVGHWDIYAGVRGGYNPQTREGNPGAVVYGSKIEGQYMPKRKSFLNKVLGDDTYIFGKAGIQLDPVKGKMSQELTDDAWTGMAGDGATRPMTTLSQEPGTKWGLTGYANVGLKKNLDDIEWKKKKSNARIKEIEDREKEAESERQEDEAWEDDVKKIKPVIPKKECPPGYIRDCRRCPCYKEKAKHPRWLRDGGISLELTQDEIQKYVDGGYVVEELPKAHMGRQMKVTSVPKEISLTYPIKKIGERIAKQSANRDRGFYDIVSGAFGLSKPVYFGQISPAFSEYGPGKRDLIANYFHQNETGFTPVEYDFSSDLGLQAMTEKYGPLKAFLLNSEFGHGEPISAFSLQGHVPNNKTVEYFNHPDRGAVATSNIFDFSFPIKNSVTGKYHEEPIRLLSYQELATALADQNLGLRRDRLGQLARKELNTLFDMQGSDIIPFEINAKASVNPKFSLYNNPVLPKDNIAGHMAFLKRLPNKEFELTTRDLWSFRPEAYNEKWGINDSFRKAQVKLMDMFGKPFVLTQTNPIQFKKGGGLPKANYGKEKKTYTAPKVEEVKHVPAKIQTYNNEQNQYELRKVMLPDRIVPGREYADVKHKMASLRKDLGISKLDHLINLYIPGAAHPIGMAKDSGLVISPETGKLFDSNTRYWLNREYGFIPHPAELLNNTHTSIARDYGEGLIEISDKPFENMNMGINYIDKYGQPIEYDALGNIITSNPFRKSNGLLDLFGQPTGGPLMIGMGMMGKPEFTKEIKNPDYFTQLLNTFDTKKLSYSSRKYYQDLINSVKNQNGLATERQFNELQRLKTGDFNFGKRGYAKGGLVKKLLSRRRKSDQQPGDWADVKPELIQPEEEAFPLPQNKKSEQWYEPISTKEMTEEELDAINETYGEQLKKEGFEAAKAAQPGYFDEAKQWISDWHNSPMYNQMVLNSYRGNQANADYITKLRKKNIETIPSLNVLETPNGATAAHSISDTGQIEVFPSGYKYGPSVYVHEGLHSSDRPRELYKWNHPAYKTGLPVDYYNEKGIDLGESWDIDENNNVIDYPSWMFYNDPRFPNDGVVWHNRVMPVSDQMYITTHRGSNWKDTQYYKNAKKEGWYTPKTDEQVKQELIDNGFDPNESDFNNIFESTKKQNKEDVKNTIYWDKKNWQKFGHDYVSSPTEVRARLGEIRYGAQKEGIYDPFTEQITPETFQNVINNGSNWQMKEAIEDLRNDFTDEEIFYMLQNISKNENEADENELQYGKYGGQFELGDEVDEATMKQLMKLGYTFEKI